jgi:hypothetical protein
MGERLFKPRDDVAYLGGSQPSVSFVHDELQLRQPCPAMLTGRSVWGRREGLALAVFHR